MNASDDDVEALVGSTILAKYRIDRLIGRGGMGAVYQATNLAIGKRVALKFLDRDAARDSDSAMRFQREAEAASAAESAHIVQIFDSGRSEDGRPFLVMELLTGEDLRARLKREGRLELPEALHVVAQVLRALARAHEAGIVHRDLKPDNVFICQRDDDATFVKIVDFGISKLARLATADTLTRRGTVLGTAFYMSPEQAQAFRDIDGRTDFYSLGTILYEALAGRPPHVGTAYEAVLIDICTKDAADVRTYAANVPEPVAKVIAKALARDRAERFQSAEEFHEALAKAAPGLVDTNQGRRARSVASRPLPALSQASNAETASGADASFATDEGTAVRPSGGVDARSARRRTIVTGVVAALGAFAVTAYLMARSNIGTTVSDPPSARLQGVAPAAMTGAAGPPATVQSVNVVAGSTPAPGASGVLRASARASGGLRPGGDKPRERSGKPKDSPNTPGTPGVADNLQLNPNGP